jgi:hypothetical protein
MEKIIQKVIKDGVKTYFDGNNYDNNGVGVYRVGNTIQLEEVCINDYGSVFDCRGYNYELTFAPSELEGIKEGFLGYFKV